MSNQSRTSASARSTKSNPNSGGASGGAQPPPPLNLAARESSACTSALFLPAYGSLLSHAVLDALQDAHYNAEYEHFCAEKIQATYRMYRQRKMYMQTRNSVLALQRVYRAHVVRQEVQQSCQGDSLGFENACFHYYATRIQAVFRGYYSRKYVDDYYARRAYIRRVAMESERVRHLAADQRREHDAESDEKRRAREEDEYVRATEKVHFMLSTVGRSGVYRRCVEHAGAETTPFATNVEEDIRRNTQRVRRAERQEQVKRIQQAEMARMKAIEEAVVSTSQGGGKAGMKKKKKKGNMERRESELSHGSHEGRHILRHDDDDHNENDESIDDGGEGAFERVYMNEDLQNMMANLSGRNSRRSTTLSGPPSGDLTGGKPKKGRYGRGCGVAPMELGGNAVEGEREGEWVGPHQVSPSTAQSCAWEAVDALPPQRPMIPLTSCCRKDHPDNYKIHSTQAQAPPQGPVTAVQTWPTPSTFSLKFKGSSHDCLLPPVQSTYNTEAAALQKSVDDKYTRSLHEKQIFKVALYPPSAQQQPPLMTTQDVKKFREELKEKKRLNREKALAKLPKGPRPEEVGAI